MSRTCLGGRLPDYLVLRMWWIGYFEAVRPPALPWFFHRDYARDVANGTRRLLRDLNHPNAWRPDEHFVSSTASTLIQWDEHDIQASEVASITESLPYLESLTEEDVSTQIREYP